MASLVRSHPKMALFAAASCIICSPVVLPLLLISSPFLLFSSLFSIGFMSLVRCLLQLRDLSSSAQRRISNNNKRLGLGFGDNESFEWAECAHGGEEGGFRQSRVHEYLEDQLKNLNAVALCKGDSGEEPLPCSFSFGSDDGMEGHNDALPCHGGKHKFQ